MTISLSPTTIRKIASVMTRRQPQVTVNAGFVYNASEGEIGRVTSFDANFVEVEYPRWYTRKDGRMDIYTVRDSWRVEWCEIVTAQHYADYDAALWETWQAGK